MSLLKCIHFAIFYNKFMVTSKMELYLRDSTIEEGQLLATEDNQDYTPKNNPHDLETAGFQTTDKSSVYGQPLLAS